MPPLSIFHMSNLSGSLEIDLSHDEANTISSSASKIDGAFSIRIKYPATTVHKMKIIVFIFDAIYVFLVQN